MEVFQLFITLVERFGLIVAACFALVQLTSFRNILLKRTNTYEKLLIMLIFGVFGIIGTNAGIPAFGAIANLRGMIAVTAGLLGGRLVGAGAGVISGGYRILLGGFTAVPCGLATILEGIGAGLISHHIRKDTLNWRLAFFITFIGELSQVCLVLAISTPFADALHVSQIFILPMVILNALGAALFVQIIYIFLKEEERAGAVQAQKALSIARRTVSHLRKGLNLKSAGETVNLIKEVTDVTAVAITDCHTMLAFTGPGEGHHLSGREIMTPAVADVIRTGTYQVINDRKNIGCAVPDCPLESAIIVPLKKKGTVVGTLILYRGRGSGVTLIDEELAVGLAHLFSTQIELEDIEQQARLLDRAEIRALQAQINPHFLFNALNTIVSFCRTDSEKARELLIHLGNFHRSSLKRGESGLISLEEELDNVRAYLMIEKARFGHRIQVSYRLNHGEGKWHIPQFTLQPLVENAVKHGLAMSDRNGLITIETAELDGDLQIMIEDNGAGMPDAERTNILSDRGESQTGAGIALSNINQRLQLLYGPEYGRMRIESKEGSGTKIYLRIPGNPIINNS